MSDTVARLLSLIVAAQKSPRAARGPVFPSPLRGEGQGEGVKPERPCCFAAPPLSVSLPQGERGPISVYAERAPNTIGKRDGRVRSAHQQIRCTSAPYDLLGGVT
jgi:hypothetical protein